MVWRSALCAAALHPGAIGIDLARTSRFSQQKRACIFPLPFVMRSQIFIGLENQSSAVLAALGTGVMLILVVFLMQKSVLSEMREGAKPDTPNIFLIDMATSELQGIRDLLNKQPGVQGKMEVLPVVSGHIESIDGVPVEKLRVNNYPKRLLQSVSLTWSDEVPEGAKMLEGHWWTKSRPSGEVVGLGVVDHVATRLHLHLRLRGRFRFRRSSHQE